MIRDFNGKRRIVPNVDLMYELHWIINVRAYNGRLEQLPIWFDDFRKPEYKNMRSVVAYYSRYGNICFNRVHCYRRSIRWFFNILAHEIAHQAVWELDYDADEQYLDDQAAIEHSREWFAHSKHIARTVGTHTFETALDLKLLMKEALV